MTPRSLAPQPLSRPGEGSAPPRLVKGVPYPRISDLLARVRPDAPAPAPADGAQLPPEGAQLPLESGQLPPHLARAFVQEVVAEELAGEVHIVRAAHPGAEGSPETLRFAAAPAEPAVVVAPGELRARQEESEEVEKLVAQLGLRDVAREALRARLVAFGEAQRRRTAYETVFVLLAFSVTVLVTAPPLVDVLLALHGTKP